MQIRICDTPNCKNVVEHEAESFVMEEHEGSVVVDLTGGSSVDRCLSCERKVRAKLLMTAWNSVKQKRKTLKGPGVTRSVVKLEGAG